MNPIILSKLFLSHAGGWRYLAHSHISTVRMFLFYVLPLSAIPPLMIYYAGTAYHENLLPALALSSGQLQVLSLVFFATELVMVFIVAGAIEGLANAAFKTLHSRGELLQYPAEMPKPPVTEKVRKVEYRDAFTLAAVAPTPLWIGSLALFVPNFMIVMTIGALALIGSAAIIYYATPAIFRIREKGEAILMGYTLIIPGMVAWAAMMYLALLSWSAITSTLAF